MAALRRILWFRRDLRLHDHPALVAAAADGAEVVAAFVVDPALWGPAGRNRRAFLAGCLRWLSDEIGGALVVRSGDPVDVIAELAAETSAAEVVATGDFGPYGRRRDQAVAAALADLDGPGELRLVDSPYVVPPGTITTGSGTPYKVFTPFFRSWRDAADPTPIETPAAADVGWVRGLHHDGIPTVDGVTAELPEPGGAAARARLDAFAAGDMAGYHELRDRPDVDVTSRLSPYLKWGCLHPRAAVSAAREVGGDGGEVFEKEIAWREFYADVMWARPDTVTESFSDALADMEIDSGPATDDAFGAWAAGQTGFPIIDAGMRQLAGEGWMHNRVRMLVGSFLVKDLHIDWRRGAAHFLDQLVDGDVASNTGGWQWVAGTGTDAAPYFRVFNPTTQSARFDPDGDYIRRWVPELADVGGKQIHDPPPEVRSATGYPEPIVDHAVEREEALRRYGEARGDVRR